jgi:hypothetical protein
MGNYDDGTGYDRDECGCAYNNPVEKALGDEGFAGTKAHTSDANKSWLRSLVSQIRFEADGKRTYWYMAARGASTSISTRIDPTAHSPTSPPWPRLMW